MWTALSQYPEGAGSAVGLAEFARLCGTVSAGMVRIDCRYGVSSPAAELFESVADGRVHGGDFYCGVLTEVAPIFQLGSLPFLVASHDEAKHLVNVFRSHYRAEFAKHGLHLLYITPWPATGLWCDRKITEAAHFLDLHARTYDALSARFMGLLGARAVHLPIGQVMQGVRSGAINAVLSSGDGTVGAELGTCLRYFHDIHYALPISFLVVNASAYGRLPPEHRLFMELAADNAERKLWSGLKAQTATNRRSAQAAGVELCMPEPAVMAVMQDKAREVRRQWSSASGIDVATLLEMASARDQPMEAR